MSMLVRKQRQMLYPINNKKGGSPYVSFSDIANFFAEVKRRQQGIYRSKAMIKRAIRP